MIITSTVQTQTGIDLGVSGFTHERATAIEILRTVIIPDTTEASFANVITGARILWVENQSTALNNAVFVGLATGVYFMEVYPGQRYTIPLVGKPTDPTLFFLFTTEGGNVRYGLWD